MNTHRLTIYFKQRLIIVMSSNNIDDIQNYQKNHRIATYSIVAFLAVLTISVISISKGADQQKVADIRSLATDKSIPVQIKITPNFTKASDIKVKDPFYPDLPQRALVFPVFDNPIWRIGNSPMISFTFTSTDPLFRGKKKSFWAWGYTFGDNGLELPVMSAPAPNSCYGYHAGTLTKSDDYHFLFPSVPSGDIISSVKMETSNGLTSNLFVPQSWWQD